jgi:hypothetical protein
MPLPGPNTPPAYTNVIFNDPLNSNANNWYEGSGCSFGSDGFHINADVSCYAPTSTPDDADVIVQTHQISGSLQQGYGLVTRAASDSSGNFMGYSFLIDGVGHWAIFKDVAATTTKLVDFTPSSAIHTGLNASNTLEVRMRGPQFYFLVNGSPVGHVSDTAFGSGHSGLTGSSGAEVVFTNFQIRAAAFTPPASTPTATATGLGSVVFQDPLTSNANGWFSGQYCFFGSDGYHINNGICGAPTEVPNDVNVSVQTRQISGSTQEAYGLIVRGTQSSSTITGYYFGIASAGAWTFIKLGTSASTTTSLVGFTANSAIHTGLNATNTLMVHAKGSHFTLFVNGVQVGTSDDTTYASGGVALAAPAPIEVVYTNLLLTAPTTAYVAPSSGRMPSIAFAHPAHNRLPMLAIAASLVVNAWHDWTP